MSPLNINQFEVGFVGVLKSSELNAISAGESEEQA